MKNSLKYDAGKNLLVQSSESGGMPEREATFDITTTISPVPIWMFMLPPRRRLISSNPLVTLKHPHKGHTIARCYEPLI